MVCALAPRPNGSAFIAFLNLGKTSEMETAGDLRYTATGTPCEKVPGAWNCLRVEIVRTESQQIIGSYERGYPRLYRTFLPFTQGDQEYALYSSDYQETRVMALPSCADLGGEERTESPFCPTDYWVAQDPENGSDGTFGLVAGCIWGDDASWKVQFLDLSDASEGQIRRDESRFPYMELSSGSTLAEAVRLHAHHPLSDLTGPWIELVATMRFDVGTGQQLTTIDVG
jgi:hypothetical protein